MQNDIDYPVLRRRAARQRNVAVRAFFRWFVRRLTRHVSASMDAIATWGRRVRSRSLLARLDERMLHDLGLSHADAWAEARKPFWRA
jgi:uncharacterized protein YjiS (DUF1127 family)